jgi:choice-of-anchor A domain-containing protein
MTRRFIMWLPCFFLALLACHGSDDLQSVKSSVMALNSQAVQIPLSDRATYLRVRSGDVADPPLVVSLASHGIIPGDRLLIKQIGDFDYNAGYGDREGILTAVFSQGNVVLDSRQGHRIPGALATGHTFDSSTTQNDIPEDFGISWQLFRPNWPNLPPNFNGIEVQVPSGATHLIIGVWDDWYSDNRDQDSDLAVELVRLHSSCEVNLSDYNLFLLEDYSGGHDVAGKVAAGGNIFMTDFAVGAGLPVSDIANTLVAGGNLMLSRGGIWGDTAHGGSYAADTSVTSYRGTVSQGTPIDFAARGAELHSLSLRLGGIAANGTTTRESWGGILLHGTDASMNVFDVDASAFTGAVFWSIDAPAGSLALINIRGAAATFTGFGISFSGGIDQHGVLYNFVDATNIDAHGFGFWGTVLAPNAHITFNNGSWDGGIYAKSLTGNAEGHINGLHHFVVPCESQP